MHQHNRRRVPRSLIQIVKAQGRARRVVNVQIVRREREILEVLETGFGGSQDLHGFGFQVVAAVCAQGSGLTA